MKTLKQPAAFIAAILFLISSVPAFASGSSVTISGLGYFLDMYSEHSFTVNMDEECSSAGVYLNGNLIEEIPSGKKTHTVTLANGTFDTFGTAVISAQAELGGETVSTSQTVRVFPSKSKTEILYQDFSGTSDAMNQIAERYDASAYDPSIWNHSREFGKLLGFNNGISQTNLKTYAATGFEGHAASDAAFVTEHPAGTSGTTNVYFDYSFNNGGHDIDSGIVDVSFDLYMNMGDEIYVFLKDTNSVTVSGKTNGTAGAWTHMSIIYDLDNCKWYVNGTQYDMVNDNGDTLEAALDYIRIRLYPKSGQSMVVDNVKIVSYELKNTEFELISPSDGDVVTTSSLEVKYSAFGAAAVKAYIDESLAARQNNITEEESSFNIQNLELGRRELKLVAEYVGGVIKEKTVSFTVTGTEKKSLGTSGSASINDFNSMEKSEYSDISSLTGFIKNHGGWKSNTGIKRIEGASASDGDYAPLFEAPVSGKSENKSVHLLNVLSSPSSGLAVGGRLVFDFDYMINTIEDEYRMFAFGLWGGNGYTLVSNGKLCGTEFSLVPGTWYHFNMVYDVEKSAWTVSVDGDTLIDDAPAVSSSFVTGRAVSFSVCTASKEQSDTPAGFALDNVTIYNEVYKNI